MNRIIRTSAATAGLAIVIAAFFLHGSPPEAGAVSSIIPPRDVMGTASFGGIPGSYDFIAAGHRISAPFEPDTGHRNGPVLHQPFVVRKPVDAATVHLYKACTEGQPLDTVKIAFYEQSKKRQVYLIVELEEAIVSSVQIVPPTDQVRRPEVPVEEVAFTYNKITWTFTDEGLEHTDDWVAAR